MQPDGASFPLPATYPFKMRCSSVGQDIPLVDTTGKDVSVVQLTRDQVLHVNGGNPASAWGRVNIPRYATCTLTELGSQGSTVTFDPEGGTPGTSGTVTALRDYSIRNDIANPAYPSPIDLEQITATNTYRPAGFTVSKAVVQGGAQDEDGNPVTVDDTFGFTAGCTFNGVNVVPTADRTFTLHGGASKTFDGLPAGASCTVTETSSGSSSSTSHVLMQGATPGPPVAGKAVTFALAADDAGQHVNAVGFTNTYTVGSVNITKNVAPAGAPWGDRNFTLRLVCTLANASPTPVYDATRSRDPDGQRLARGQPADGCLVHRHRAADRWREQHHDHAQQRDVHGRQRVGRPGHRHQHVHPRRDQGDQARHRGHRRAARRPDRHLHRVALVHPAGQRAPPAGGAHPGRRGARAQRQRRHHDVLRPADGRDLPGDRDRQRPAGAVHDGGSDLGDRRGRARPRRSR